MSNDKLVDALGNPNAWWRETAARLLLERQDKTVADKLRQTALNGKSPLERIGALRLLEGLQVVDDALLLQLCDDANPRIVEQAIIVADSHVADSKQLRERIAKLAGSKDARVRFQALMVAMPLPRAPKHPADQWEEVAMLIAAGDRGGDAVKNILGDLYSLRRT